MTFMSRLRWNENGDDGERASERERKRERERAREREKERKRQRERERERGGVENEGFKEGRVRCSLMIIRPSMYTLKKISFANDHADFNQELIDVDELCLKDPHEHRLLECEVVNRSHCPLDVEKISRKTQADK